MTLAIEPKSKLLKVKLSSLKLDYNIYPRHQIDSYHVTQMVEAIQSGTELPPIVINKKDKRIVDGFHRFKAYQKLLGKTAVIIVETREYVSEIDLFQDAVSLNSAHGKSLSSYDVAHIINKAEELEMAPEVVASMLHMTLEKIGEMKIHRTAIYNMEPVSLKGTTGHFAGKELSDDQNLYNTKAGGPSQLFFVNQVILMLRLNTANWENKNLVEGLKTLYELLQMKLP